VYHRLEHNASLLLRYMTLRRDQTLISLSSIFDEALHDLDGNRPRRIAIIEGSKYDWSGGLWSDSLDEQSGIVDEIWCGLESSGFSPQNTDYRVYMSSRGRYHIRAFLEFCASVTNPALIATTGLGQMSEGYLRSIMNQRAQQALAWLAKTRSAFLALPATKAIGATAPGRLGVVVPAFDEPFSLWYTNRVQIASGIPGKEGDEY
jgi:hypothetical protein